MRLPRAAVENKTIEQTKADDRNKSAFRLSEAGGREEARNSTRIPTTTC